MDITDNVLFLLTNKMSQLPERIQSVLKVVSCFGSTIYASAVGLLSSTSEYSNIKECLEELVWESFIVAVAGDFKFVHDKVNAIVLMMRFKNFRSHFLSFFTSRFERRLTVSYPMRRR